MGKYVTTILVNFIIHQGCISFLAKIKNKTGSSPNLTTSPGIERELKLESSKSSKELKLTTKPFTGRTLYNLLFHIFIPRRSGIRRTQNLRDTAHFVAGHFLLLSTLPRTYTLTKKIIAPLVTYPRFSDILCHFRS